MAMHAIEDSANEAETMRILGELQVQERRKGVLEKQQTLEVELKDTLREYENPRSRCSMKRLKDHATHGKKTISQRVKQLRDVEDEVLKAMQLSKLENEQVEMDTQGVTVRRILRVDDRCALMALRNHDHDEGSMACFQNPHVAMGLARFSAARGDYADKQRYKQAGAAVHKTFEKAMAFTNAYQTLDSRSPNKGPNETSKDYGGMATPPESEKSWEMEIPTEFEMPLSSAVNKFDRWMVGQLQRQQSQRFETTRQRFRN
eukprot:TRINITY_DN4955_c0_g2_i1.p1 TRINITY_DN4955_c0_g2~~TRINITY_DN4955_c0_g2_i1.p1  ORF type:complete len:260 (-),score=38.11 TRINITY_DN4955_c0_g2_i1:131-910(-)